MARVNIEARVVRGRATAGGREPAGLVVAASDDGGKPLGDLALEHFQVRIVAASSATDAAVTSLAAKGEGIYWLEVMPADGAAWSGGEVVLAVHVRRVFERGQGLAVLALG